MCKYCDSVDGYTDGSYWEYGCMSFMLDYSKAEGWFLVALNDLDISLGVSVRIPVNNCPMCGRKMAVDAWDEMIG